jgi:hypothetical protein
MIFGIEGTLYISLAEQPAPSLLTSFTLRSDSVKLSLAGN